MDSGYLLKILQDLGSENCDRNMFLDVLQQIKPQLNQDKVEEQVALSLLMMISQPASPEWNVVAFGASVLETFPKIDVNQTILYLDQPSCFVSTPSQAEKLIKGLKELTKNFVNTAKAESFMKPWKNGANQLSLVFNLLLLPPEVFSVASISSRKIINPEELPTSPSQKALQSIVNPCWNSLDLFELVAARIDSENFEAAKPIFELASRNCPELLCVALAILDPAWNSINKEILVKLTCGFILGQPSSPIVLPRVWSRNPNIMLFCMVEMHRRDSSCLPRLLDVAQELKILHIILDAKPFSFTIDLACFASRRQHLNLEKWLMDALRNKGDTFATSALDFLTEKAALFLNQQANHANNSSLSLDLLELLLRLLHSHRHLLSTTGKEQLSEIQVALGIECKSPIPETSPSNAAISFPAEVEEEVNNLFDKLFAREISVPQILDILKRLKGSTSYHEQQVFSCFLQNMFDEYRFFSKYPENELNLTAVLFGQLINHGLISNVPLNMALRCILDSLKKQPNQKIFKFGLQAILQFYQRLQEWPQYCHHVSQIPHIQKNFPDLYSYLVSCANANVIDNVPTNAPSKYDTVPLQNQSSADGNPLIVSLHKVKISGPPDLIKDRILFIMNNLSVVNMEAKANDLVKIIEEGHFPWLAQYLVVFRVSQEPNFHHIYLSFLSTLRLKGLEDQVLQETYQNIYVLLDSKSIIGSSSERSILRNLGMWLGGLTLANDKPILHRDLSLKDLLLDAFARDRLIVIIPFVCKVIEQCCSSRAFIPENPWLMAILRLLCELYNFANIKLNLKFEIEVLCKNLGVDLHSLEPSVILKVTKEIGSSETNLPEPILFPFLSSANSTLSDPIKILLSFSIEFAVRDLVAPVAEKATAQAFSTTKIVAGNDFSNESNDSEYIKAAVNMASALVIHLSGTLSREPLRGLIVGHGKSLVNHVNGLNFSGTSVESLAEDHLDLACALIEKMTSEYSRAKIASFVEKEVLTRPRNPHGPKTSAEKLRAYDEFARKARPSYISSLPSLPLTPSSQAEHEQAVKVLFEASKESAVVNGTSQPNLGSSLMSPGLPASEGNLDSYFETICIRFVEMVSLLEKIVLEVSSEVDSVAKLTPSSEIRALMKQIIVLASSSPIHRDELCLLMSQRLMQGLYKTESLLYIDVIILLLIKIFEFSSKAAKEVTTWVVHSTDERKYSVLATSALFGSGLIYVLDFDGQLAKQIEVGKEAAIAFAVSLIRRCVFGEVPVAAPYDFVFSLEALGKVSQSNQSKKEITHLLDDIASLLKAPQPEAQVLRDQITFCFTDWFRLCQYPSISDKLISSFVGQLFQRRFMDNDSNARLFFQICTELCIELYVRQRRAPAILAYRSIDAYARLVGQIIKFHPEQDTQLSPLRIITIVHSVAGLILVQGLEQGLDYLQRPFSRLFASLSEECINSSSENSWNIVENIGTFYSTISPRNCPSFTFGWLEIVSNKHFLPHLINGDSAAHSLLAHLITELLETLSPLFTVYDENESTKTIYKGCIRVVLMLLHDCPAFLSRYGYSFITILPSNATQLINVISCALPHFDAENQSNPLSARVPSKLDFVSINEALQNLDRVISLTCQSCNFDDIIHSKGDKQQVSRAIGLQFIDESFRFSSSSCGLICSLMKHFLRFEYKVNMPLVESFKESLLLNSIVEGITALHDKPAEQLELISSISKYLGSSSAITCLFQNTLLALYEKYDELVLRVLMERLIVHRPHPWGLMVLFIELAKNPRFSIMKLPSVQNNSEIHRLVEVICQL